MEDRIKNTMAAVLGVEPESIDESTTPRDIVGWDSINHLKLVAALEEEFDITFEDDEIETLVSFSVIAATIESYID